MRKKVALGKNDNDCKSPGYHLHTGSWPRSYIAESEVFYPGVNHQDRARIRKLLRDIEHMLLTRADGVSFVITRARAFPQENGRNIIDGVLIKTWDIAA